MEYVRLGDIAEIGRGSSPRPITDQRYFAGGTIPWIKIADATASGKNIYNTKEHVNEYGASFSRKLPIGSLIIAASGTLGFPKFLGVEGCIHDGWMYFTNFNESKIDKHYLYYALIELGTYYNNISYGAAIQNINTPIVKKTRIGLPCLHTQKKIASILSTYDTLIESNTKRIRLLEQMAENLYKEWFVRFRFPGHENVEMEKGVPKNWKKGTLKDICEFKRGKNITSDEMSEGNVPVISAGITPSGYHNKANVKGVSVTMSSSGANAGYISFHYSDIWAADCSFVDSQTTKYIYYVYEMLNNMRIVINNFQRGAAQPHVYPKDINRIRLIIPEEPLVAKANEQFKKLHNEIKNLQEQNSLLTRQRDLLLPRLMSGKLEVKP